MAEVLVYSRVGTARFLLLASLLLSDIMITNGESAEDRVTYLGHTHPRSGAGWFITCKNLLESDKVNWTRNRVLLQPEIDRQELTLLTTASESTISSSDSKPSQSGTYKCTADSLQNHTLQVYVSDSVEDRVTYVGHEHPRPGAGWQIACKNLLESDKVNWTRNGISLQPEIDRQELTLLTTASESTISSSDSKPSQSGTYKCTADSLRNHTLQVYVSGASNEHKNDTEESTVRAPKISTKSHRIYHVLAPGNSLTLPCTLAESEKVYWKLGDIDLIIVKGHYELSKTGKKLTIKNPIKTSLGNYSCRVNRTSPTPLQFYQVIDQPTVRVDPAKVALVKGETLRLTCITEAKYGPRISWVFNHKIFTVSEDRVKLTPDNQGVENAVLTVESVSINDIGFASCSAAFKNVLGSGNATAQSFLVEGEQATRPIFPYILCILGIITMIVGVIFLKKKRNTAKVDNTLAVEGAPVETDRLHHTHTNKS